MIDATHLLSPAANGSGEVMPDIIRRLKPDMPIEAVAELYAEEGNRKVKTWALGVRRDDGAIAWAHYRMFYDRAQQIFSNAISLTAEGEGSKSQSVGQGENLMTMANRWLAKFMLLEGEEFPATAKGQPPRRSVSTPSRVRW